MTGSEDSTVDVKLSPVSVAEVAGERVKPVAKYLTTIATKPRLELAAGLAEVVSGISILRG